MQLLSGFTDEEYKQAETLYEERIQKGQNLIIQTGVRKKNRLNIIKASKKLAKSATNLESGIWNLESGIWNLELEIRN